MNVADITSLLKKSYENNLSDYKNYQVDRSLSGQRCQVYFNPTTHKAYVVHRGSQGSVDWLNTNLRMGLFNDTNTSRFQHSRDIQKMAEQKYGKDNIITLAHSLGSKLAESAAAKGSKIITYNGVSLPNDIFKATNKNQVNIRTNNDVVSFLKPIVQNSITRNITSGSYNPIAAHMFNGLEQMNQHEIIGNGVKRQNNWIRHVKQFCLDNRMSYKEALTNNKCKSSYRK
jgi:hypothetical protein